MPYHLNTETGNVNVCTASVQACPHGEAAHYPSEVEARAAYEHGQSLPASMKRRFTEAQYSALKVYQSGMFYDVNYALRQDLSRIDERLFRVTSGLDSLLSESDEVAPNEVYRVVYTGEDYLEETLQVGQLVYEEGYLSTSESEEFVEDCFDHGFDDGEVNTLLTIETNPAIGCVRPKGHTYNHDHEEEVLFARGVVFEVLEDDRSGSRRYIRLRMVKHDPDELHEAKS